MTTAHRRFTDSPRYRAIWSTAIVDWTLIAVLSYFLAVFVSQHESQAKEWCPFFIMAVALGYLIRRRWNDRSGSQPDDREAMRRESTEDRLDELERLKRRDMVTAEEYAAKRQEILNDL